MLKEKLESDLKVALKSSDSLRREVLRLVLTQTRNEEIKIRVLKKELDDDHILEILKREVKKRKEAAEIFTKGNRKDLADKELKEAEIIKEYLPAEMDRESIKKTVSEIHTRGISDFGGLMKEAMKTLKGKADGKVVSEIVCEVLDGKTE